MGAKGMTISRFAAAAGVGVETVRYYQRRGLLPVPRAGATSYREYDEAMLRRLKFVRRLQSAGFTLREIRDLVRLDRTTDRLRIQEIAGRKLEQVADRIRELEDVSRGLRALVGTCRRTAPGDSCPIVEAFDS